MVEQLSNGLGESLNISGNVSEQASEVSEQQIAQVVAQLSQGQQIAHQRVQARKQNSQIADFLTFLMQSEDEHTIQGLTKIFFFTASGMRVSDTPLHLIVALFIPFYHQQALEYDLKKLYEQDLSFDQAIDLHSYLTFVKKTFDEYATAHPTQHHYGYAFDLDKGDFVSLVIGICLAHGLIEKNQSDLDSVRGDMQHLVGWSQMDESQRYHLLKKIPQEIQHFFVSLSS